PLALLSLLGLAGLVAAPAAAVRVKVAAVLVSPSGATLHPGDPIQFTARAVDGQGQVVPGVNIVWSSSRSSVLQINSSGSGTAGNSGSATITARAGQKKAKIVVTVTPGGESPALVAADLTQVNHVLVDDQWVYWTEVDKKVVRVRKTPRAGGPIYDLASEPSRDKRGVAITYARLQQIGDTLFFSRQSLGFLDHWSIRSVSRDGGPVTEVLKEDASIEPLDAAAWRVSGQYLVAALAHPEKIGLASNVRIAAYDPATTSWAPLVAGHFEDGKYRVVAADNGAAYVRGLTAEFTQLILRVEPGAPVNSFQTIFSLPDTDGDLSEPGDSDGTNVYFWSNRGGSHKLLSLPVSGGSTTTLLNGGFGFGLRTSGGNLYWARSGDTLVRLPVGGGTPTPLQSSVSETGVLGGVAVGDDGVYFPRKEPKFKTSLRKTAL
ncbi:MAG TPA: Ig-like domain-containing protein, partial [Armatimonadota bacterium]|nr:Ig-like domain-containing protein [Armatimonadota bacterium]